MSDLSKLVKGEMSFGDFFTQNKVIVIAVGIGLAVIALYALGFIG